MRAVDATVGLPNGPHLHPSSQRTVARDQVSALVALILLAQCSHLRPLAVALPLHVPVPLDAFLSHSLFLGSAFDASSARSISVSDQLGVLSIYL